MPFARAKFRLKGSQPFNFRYTTSTIKPNLTQLVTIPDNLNPNSIYIGNPTLKPEYTHSIFMNYFTFDPVNETNIYFGIQLNSTDHKIINQTIIQEDFTTVRTPQNSGFYQGVELWAGLNQPIKK